MQLWLLNFTIFTTLVLQLMAFLRLNRRLERLSVFATIIALLLMTYELTETGYSLLDRRALGHQLVFFTTGFYLLLVLRYQLKFSGIFFIAPLLLLKVCMPPLTGIDSVPGRESWLFSVHSFTSVLALALLTLSFCSACLFLLQERQFKTRNFGFLSRRLPALATLDHVGFITTLGGFLFLTLAIVSGGLRRHDGTIGLYLMGKREWLIFGAWLFYGFYFRIRFSVGLLGTRLAWVTVISYLVQIFALFLMIGLHRF